MPMKKGYKVDKSPEATLRRNEEKELRKSHTSPKDIDTKLLSELAPYIFFNVLETPLNTRGFGRRQSLQINKYNIIPFQIIAIFFMPSNPIFFSSLDLVSYAETYHKYGPRYVARIIKAHRGFSGKANEIVKWEGKDYPVSNLEIHLQSSPYKESFTFYKQVLKDLKTTTRVNNRYNTLKPNLVWFIDFYFKPRCSLSI